MTRAVVLRQGSEGTAVRQMQERLNEALAIIRVRECRTDQDATLRDIDIDGSFGPDTERALRLIQQYARDHNMRDAYGRPITVDGVYGPQTAGVIGSLIATGTFGNIGVSSGAAYVPSAAYTTGLPTAGQDTLTVRRSDIVRPENMDACFAACRRQVPSLTREGFETALDNAVDRINSLHPDMRASVALGIRDLYADGYPVTVGGEGGMRGRAAQNRAHAQGFSQVRYGGSFHNYGLALDVVMAKGDGSPDDQFPDGQLRAIRAAMQVQGLHTITGPTGWDPCHFQYAPRNTSARGFARAMSRGDDGFLELSGRRVNDRIHQATYTLLGDREPPPEVRYVSRDVRRDEPPMAPMQIMASFTRDPVGTLVRMFT
jgi:peptidoglycan hydrolase-like protein with peptidoglycan-binding domain